MKPLPLTEIDLGFSVAVDNRRENINEEDADG
jgi:hypothetical protein